MEKKYIDLLGMEKLLATPAYRVERLSDGAVFIRLTESIFDMHENYEEADAVRQRVKAYLDDNVFFDPEDPSEHVYRTPYFAFPG